MKQKIKDERAFSYLEVMVGMCILACTTLVIGSICEEAVTAVYWAQKAYETTYNANNVMVCFKDFFNNPTNRECYQRNPHYNLSKIIEADNEDEFYNLQAYDYTIGLMPLNKELDDGYFFTTIQTKDLEMIGEKVKDCFPYYLDFSIKEKQKAALLGVSDKLEAVGQVAYIMVLIVEHKKSDKVVKHMIQLYTPEE